MPEPFNTKLGILPPVSSLAFFFAVSSPCSRFISNDAVSDDSSDSVSVSTAVSMLGNGISFVGQFSSADLVFMSFAYLSDSLI